MKGENSAKEHQHHMADDRHTSRPTSSAAEENDGQIMEDDIIGENVLSDETLSQLQDEQERRREDQKKRLTEQQDTEPSPPRPRTKEMSTLKLRDNYCPRCGNILVERDGPYGEFFGCSSYPMCPYTRDKRHGLIKGKSHPKLGYTAMNRSRKRRGPKL